VISSKKKLDCDEPDLTSNEKTQPIQWTEQPTGALVAAGSLWPLRRHNATPAFLKIVMPQGGGHFIF
jgi:hypothetical protein